MDTIAVDPERGRRFHSMRRLIGNTPLLALELRVKGEHGLAVGISSGANVIGALRVQERLGPKAVVATVLADSNKKYLSTDLCGPSRSRTAI